MSDFTTTLPHKRPALSASAFGNQLARFFGGYGVAFRISAFSGEVNEVARLL